MVDVVQAAFQSLPALLQASVHLAALCLRCHKQVSGVHIGG